MPWFRLLPPGIAGLLLCLCAATAHAQINDDIAQVPLSVAIGAVHPNVMFILDDSGSMDWAFMPDEAGTLVTRNHIDPRAFSGEFNRVYYHPKLRYPPPHGADGEPLPDARFAAASRDGYGSTPLADEQVDLASAYVPSWGSLLEDPRIRELEGPKRAYFNLFTGDEDLVDSTAHPYYAATYGGYYDAGCTATPEDADCYVRITVPAAEETHFANWFSYYRNRMFTARAGISRAFATQDERLRVGFGRLWAGFAGNRYTGTREVGPRTVDGVSGQTIERGVRPFRGRDRDAFFHWLFSQQQERTTPTRRALDDAGRYFRHSSRPWQADEGDERAMCRASHTIVMSDGYWNDGPPTTVAARHNIDGNTGPAITDAGGTRRYQYRPVSPFADAHGGSGDPNANATLADVAMYYWNRDLRPDIPNGVPTSPDDPAFWQHMVTYTVGLGLEGTVDPEHARLARRLADDDDPDNDIDIDWPRPVNGGGTANLDDLLHAAINGRGDFFSAADPAAFAAALDGILDDIGSRQDTATGLAGSASLTQGDELSVIAGFDSTDWSGELIAIRHAPDPAGGQPGARELWRTSATLSPAQAAQRRIFIGHAGAVVPFEPSLRDRQLRTRIQGPYAATQVDALIDYLRGDDTQESANGGPFRDRGTLLGDIVNAGPVVVAPRNQGWLELDGYAAHLDTQADRPPMVFVGANDGMLHGFDADGRERFAYIPDAVVENLHALADPGYTHRFYVDGKSTLGDAQLGGRWTTLLATTTGAGGKGIFTLDVGVASPAQMGAANVLWDISAASGEAFEHDLGYTLGAPLIDRLADGTWVVVFGNGYGSDGKRAVLYVVNAADGNLLAKLDTGVGTPAAPNGLSTPSIARSFKTLEDPITGKTTVQPYARHVFAGDLHGNLWKFDLSDTRGSGGGSAERNGRIAYGGKPMFNTLAPDGRRQPITAGPTLSSHPAGGYVIYVGTGKFFSPGDQVVDRHADTQPIDSFYAIRDTDSGEGEPIVLSSALDRDAILHAQTLQAGGTVSAAGTRRNTRNVPLAPVDWATKRGWYLDLRLGSTDRPGERVLTTPTVLLGDVAFATYEPGHDPCSPGGTNRMYLLDALNGHAALHLPEEPSGGDVPTCPRGGGCAAVELGSGPPIAPMMTIAERRDEHGQIVSYQRMINLPSISSADGTPTATAIDSGEIPLGRVYWLDPNPR